MNYLNLGADVVQHPWFLRATDAQIRTWLCLLAYCHRQDNHGKIDNPSEWADGEWAQIGISKALIDAKCTLWHLNGPGNMLHVHFWDETAQLNYLKRKRDGAKYVSRRKDRKKPPENLGHLQGGLVGDHLGDSLRKEVSKEVNTPDPAAAQPTTPPINGNSHGRSKVHRSKFQRPREVSEE